MSKLITPVLLSGGAGTRLWPLSTKKKPKQFLSLIGRETLLATTLERLSDKQLFANPIIVGSLSHQALINSHLDTFAQGGGTIICEPSARNTAPAIALAALACEPDDILLILPSDHDIKDQAAFLAAVRKAAEAARGNYLVTLGIEPTSPETGYGYIEIDAASLIAEGVHRVTRFVEKPSRDSVEVMIAHGNFMWNAGIFIFRAGTYLEQLRQLEPTMLDACQAAMDGAARDDRLIIPDALSFAQSSSNSIDYAVMERAKKVACVPVSMGWSDVGSWDALYELELSSIETAQPDGNVLAGNVTALECENSFLRAEGVKIAAYGVENLIVVATGTEVLILPKGQAQHVKDLLAAMRAKDEEA